MSGIEVVSDINYEQLAKEQSTDTDFKLLCSANTSLKFKPYVLSYGRTLWCEISQNSVHTFLLAFKEKKLINLMPCHIQA